MSHHMQAHDRAMTSVTALVPLQTRAAQSACSLHAVPPSVLRLHVAAVRRHTSVPAAASVASHSPQALTAICIILPAPAFTAMPGHTHTRIHPYFNALPNQMPVRHTYRATTFKTRHALSTTILINDLVESVTCKQQTSAVSSQAGCVFCTCWGRPSPKPFAKACQQLSSLWCSSLLHAKQPPHDTQQGQHSMHADFPSAPQHPPANTQNGAGHAITNPDNMATTIRASRRSTDAVNRQHRRKAPFQPPLRPPQRQHT